MKPIIFILLIVLSSYSCQEFIDDNLIDSNIWSENSDDFTDSAWDVTSSGGVWEPEWNNSSEWEPEWNSSSQWEPEWNSSSQWEPEWNNSSEWEPEWNSSSEWNESSNSESNYDDGDYTDSPRDVLRLARDERDQIRSNLRKEQKELHQNVRDVSRFTRNINDLPRSGDRLIRKTARNIRKNLDESETFNRLSQVFGETAKYFEERVLRNDDFENYKKALEVNTLNLVDKVETTALKAINESKDKVQDSASKMLFDLTNLFEIAKSNGEEGFIQAVKKVDGN